MIINSHVHIYPDNISKIIEDNFMKMVGPIYSSFKVSSLLEDMARCGVDTSIVFCVAERAKIVQAANDFVIRLQDNKKVVALGTIHPDFADFKQEIQRLRQSGIRGIKATSAFQDFSPDEERMLKIYQELGEDMVLYLHAGEDPGKPAGQGRSTPQKIARVLEMFPKMKVVAAHLGGLFMLEETKKFLWGKDLYLDTVWAPSVADLGVREVAQFIQRHGSHKILFGTDFPIIPTKKEIEWIAQLPISPEDKDLILYKNAQRLFGI